MEDVINVFFFQAEDGIRDIGVTGVQTCALPICEVQADEPAGARLLRYPGAGPGERDAAGAGELDPAREAQRGEVEDPDLRARSEERRVGKERRSRWSPYH